MAEFNGFPIEMSKFFTELSINNTKKWFDEHRDEYENYVREPARAFVQAMAEPLKKMVPGINAIPKVNRSLFRINRDLRFSKNKEPYKTNLGLLFWEGALKKRTRYPGLYLQYSTDFSFLGSGMYSTDKENLKLWREALTRKAFAKNLYETIESLKKMGYMVKGKHYKRKPAGYEINKYNEELLLYRGIWTMKEIKDDDIFFKPELVDFCIDHFRNLKPLHQLLVEIQTA
ncbi:MAG: DUF2461 domain-containing protein [Candidatus Zixiibacteriota bacterium]